MFWSTAAAIKLYSTWPAMGVPNFHVAVIQSSWSAPKIILNWRASSGKDAIFLDKSFWPSSRRHPKLRGRNSSPKIARKLRTLPQQSDSLVKNFRKGRRRLRTPMPKQNRRSRRFSDQEGYLRVTLYRLPAEGCLKPWSL